MAVIETVRVSEARVHFSRLLAEVAEGQTITIAKHGTPVAQLVPAPNARRPDVGLLIEEWRAYREEHGIRLDGLTIRELIEDGGRFSRSSRSRGHTIQPRPDRRVPPAERRGVDDGLLSLA